MLTKYGQEVRRYRNKRGLRLKDMAEHLEVSSAYLSAMETGTKSVPDSIVVKISEYLNLTKREMQELRSLATQSTNEVRIQVKEKSKRSKEVASVFARKFPNMRDVDLKEILRVLEKVPEKGG